MDLLGALVPIASLIVAGMSVYLAHKSRQEPFQKALYDLQVKAASDTADALVSTQSAIDRVALSIPSPILDDEKSHAVFAKLVKSPKEELRRTILRYSPFLPTQVFSALSEYLAHLELVLGEMHTSEGFHSIGRYTQTRNPWDDFYANFAIAITSIRDFLGVGPLTSSIARTLGATKREPHAEVAKRARELIRLLQREYDTPTSPMLDIGT
jgi:hypothetical protein